MKTREDIEREGLQIIASIDESDPTNVPLPLLFEVSLKLYSLIKNFSEYQQSSRFEELAELAFQRYRPILKVVTCEKNLSLIYLSNISSFQVIYHKSRKLKI